MDLKSCGYALQYDMQRLLPVLVAITAFPFHLIFFVDTNAVIGNFILNSQFMVCFFSPD
jgi:hypothetical protein